MLRREKRSYCRLRAAAVAGASAALLLCGSPALSAPRVDEMAPIAEQVTARRVVRQVRPQVRRVARAAWSKPAPRQSGGGLVAVPCGRSKIMVAQAGAVQWAGFCKDFAAIYDWGSGFINGYRNSGTCHQANKHRCGGAADWLQRCRSKGPGHCGIPLNFPVAASERLADKWGLWPGSRWGNRDVGHFEIRGGLASNGWRPKMDVSALPEPAAPKRWPIAMSEISALPAKQEAVRPPPISSPMNLIVPEEQERSVRLVHLASFGMTWATDDLVDLDALRETPTPEVPKVDLSASAWRPRPMTIEVAAPSRFPDWSPLDAVRNAAWLFGVPYAMMHSIVKIESDYNPHDRTGSYKGLCQMSDYEFAKYGQGNIWNARDNALACAKMMANHAARFEAATGLRATYARQYMIHQQGWEGAAEHYLRPDRAAYLSMCATEDGREKGEKWCKKAIWGNMLPEWKRETGSVENVTSGYFVAKWTARVDKFAAVKAALEVERGTGLPILVPPEAIKVRPAKARPVRVHRGKQRAQHHAGLQHRSLQ